MVIRAQTTRRDFLLEMARAGIAAGAASALPLIALVTGCAHEVSPFAHLTPAEARAMRAFAAQILPSDVGAPGAEEAGAVYFVDHAFGDPFFADAVPLLRAGLAELDARATHIGARNGFSSLSDGDQRSIMRALEPQPFFATARTLVLIGTFGDPSHGGNRGGVGARIVRMEHRMSYTAPYGWYDAHL